MTSDIERSNSSAEWNNGKRKCYKKSKINKLKKRKE